MNMDMAQPPGVMDAVVFGAVAFALLFTLTWALSPRLRGWIEQPKFRFQETVQEFDRENR
jgi:hypothetical protein